MRRPFLASSTTIAAASAGIVALGVAVNDGFAPTPGSAAALVLIVVGLFGVASAVGDRPVEALRLATRRWWAVAFAVFLPYGLATAPANDRAAAVGEAFSDPVAATVLEAAVGAAVLSAVAVTVLYWFASNGVHPGRPAPEERVLNEGRGD